MTADVAPHHRKAPRRTAERIADAALDLFNHYGEPQVSTNRIAAELNISPGNLHYHFKSKDDLLLALFQSFDAGLRHLTSQASDVSTRAEALAWFGRVLSHVWDFRFLIRHLGDLVTRIRAFEPAVPALLITLDEAVDTVLACLCAATQPPARHVLRNSLCGLLMGRFNLEFLRDPRHAMESAQADAVITRALGEIDGLLTLAGALR